MTLGELIEKLGGRLAQGSAETPVTGVNASELAAASERVQASELLFAEDAASAAEALASPAAAVVVKPGCLGSYASNAAIAVIESDQPRLWFARAAKLLTKAPPAAGVHTTAVVGAEVKLGADVTIAACAVIGECAQIGAGTSIEAGAVIGGDHGFGHYTAVAFG